MEAGGEDGHGYLCPGPYGRGVSEERMQIAPPRAPGSREPRRRGREIRLWLRGAPADLVASGRRQQKGQGSEA